VKSADGQGDLDLRTRALRLYEPPFRRGGGYIFDANHEVVAMVRGWGKISHQPCSEELQDTAGDLFAEALSRFWGEELARLSSRGPA
jgi:hypothetical protein